jgi:DNA mismatch repair protein MutS
VPQDPNTFNALSYRLLHSQDYAMVKYSVRHIADFYRGLKKLSELSSVELPGGLQYYIDRINKVLREEPLNKLADTPPATRFTRQENLYYAHHLRT